MKIGAMTGKHTSNPVDDPPVSAQVTDTHTISSATGGSGRDMIPCTVDANASVDVTTPAKPIIAPTVNTGLMLFNAPVFNVFWIPSLFK